MLRPNYTSRFQKDLKRLTKKHVDLKPLIELMNLIVENSEESISVLLQHHNMHRLKGSWKGSLECHVANAGNWLVIWKTTETEVYFQRTGSHEELFE